MSNTPLTDMLLISWDMDVPSYVMTRHARFIELKFNAANERIKRLEEALTEIELAMKQPASNSRLMQIAGPARQALNIINQAKEAKP